MTPPMDNKIRALLHRRDHRIGAAAGDVHRAADQRHGRLVGPSHQHELDIQVLLVEKAQLARPPRADYSPVSSTTR